MLWRLFTGMAALSLLLCCTLAAAAIHAQFRTEPEITFDGSNHPRGQHRFVVGVSTRCLFFGTATGTFGVSARFSEWRVGRFTAANGSFALFFLPHWLLLSTTALLPAIWLAISLRHALRRRHRLARGCCLTCGYDLRASPERCPECGEAAPAGA